MGSDVFSMFGALFSGRRIFRRMGYYGDQSGILRRYRRERQGWDEHLQHTRRFITAAAQNKRRQSAIVLGSGWLLDVPLQELSGMFDRVTLTDVRHPRTVKRQAAKSGNVELLACDISGFALPVYRYAQKYRNKRQRPPLDVICPDAAPDLSAYDFVVSCNVLTQLDILLIDYLRLFFLPDEEEIIAFRKKVQQTHIEMLPQHRSCLITDTTERTLTPGGEEQCMTLLYHPVALRIDAQRWKWIFDTGMTYYPDKKTILEVMAVEI
ncbi:MAG: class I SAM-dependent methyltransferase [Bacteroidales bacterium]|jgi:hypothetical protein|nr:class I SAM-dependent methyltransferase [Bacteroidales bacterium]